MILGHRIRLVPNLRQEDYFKQACGVARFAYNWGLAEWKLGLARGEHPSEAAIRRRLNAVKDAQFPWMRAVGKCVPQHAIRNLGKAFSNRGMATRRYGEPRFKRKGQSESFRFDNGIEKRKHHAVRIHGKYIHVPRLGWVKMREEVRFTGTVRSATISRQADRWYASLAIETPHRVPDRNDHSVAGCDLGISTFAVIADESGCRKYFAPKPLTNMMIRLRRLHRACTRKVPGSSNWSKAKTKLRRTYARISDIRLDALHKITIDLVRKHRTIGIEDLNPTGIMSNRHVSRSAFDVAFGEFRRQFTYKSVMNGTTLVVIDRWYASSKTCSACGWVNADLAFGPAWECRVKPAALKQEGLQIADRNGQEVVVLYQSQTP